MTEPTDDATPPAAMAPLHWRPQFARRVEPTVEDMVADIQAVAARTGVAPGGSFTRKAYRAGGGRYTASQFVGSIGWKRAARMAGFTITGLRRAVRRASDGPREITAASLAA